MLQVTPAFDESFVTVALKDCVPPSPRVALAGLTLTLMEGVDVDVEPPAAPPPPQPARKVKVDNPQKTAPRRKRADISPHPDISASIILIR
jgi:hypothetical protein